MGWIGKLIGGTIGLAIGGPLGAIAGAAFGHAYDTASAETDQPATGQLSTGETAQFTFFVAAFSMLAKLARADGKITDAEIASIERFMVNDLRLSTESRSIAVNIFNAALDSSDSFQDFAQQFYLAFQTQPQMLELMIDILVRVSVADGSMSTSEEQLILGAVHVFHFSEEAYRQIKAKYVSDLDRYYAILQCKPQDPIDHIKNQYRSLVQKFHPDKIAAKGLPEEFTRFAEDRFKEIQAAYEAIKKERGIK